MDTKTKIKLLADLQAATENETLKSVLAELPSGEIVLQVFETAMEKRINNILEGVTEEEATAHTSAAEHLRIICDLVRDLDHSALIPVLKKIEQKLSGTETSQPPAPQQQQPQQTYSRPAPADDGQHQENSSGRSAVPNGGKVIPGLW